MSRAAGGDRRRVAVVTGGGRGIGASIAEELGRRGHYVVTLDPLVALDGSVDASSGEEPTTAQRIVGSGGAARAVSASVTDPGSLEELFGGIVEEFGHLDSVVNVAGITRPTSFASGSENDWRAVLEVHLGGYLNVLAAALPHMAGAGHGHILGVTSGAGWRPGDAGAYSCAKRAVASLTWRLGSVAPEGVTVNALSPIAMTRMVEAAMERHRASRGTEARSSASGGLKLGAGMPAPSEIAPLAAELVDERTSWCSGQVVFAAGSELSVIEAPRLLEVLRAEPTDALAAVLDAAGDSLSAAHEHQQSTGGAGPRFGERVDSPTPAPNTTAVRSAVIADDQRDGGALEAALDARGAEVGSPTELLRSASFGEATSALAGMEERCGPLDSVVTWLGEPGGPVSDTDWRSVLGSHDGMVDRLLGDAAWVRAVADHAERSGRPLRLVTLVDAGSPQGRTRAEASAQLARAASGATGGSVTAVTVGVESTAARETAAQLAAYVATNPAAAGLSGAELLAGPAWVALSSHPRVGTSITYGGSEVPDWVGDMLHRAVSGSHGDI